MTVRTYLDGLVRIWERWTDDDPLLRCVVHAAEQDGDTPHELLDEVIARLTALAEPGRLDNTGAYAAMLATWAALLAVTSENLADDAVWRAAARDAQEAHREALAARRHAIEPSRHTFRIRRGHAPTVVHMQRRER
jgi:hypothetical protein